MERERKIKRAKEREIPRPLPQSPLVFAVGFRIPNLWILDSKLSVIPDSKVLNSGFHSYFKGRYFLNCN